MSKHLQERFKKARREESYAYTHRYYAICFRCTIGLDREAATFFSYGIGMDSPESFLITMRTQWTQSTNSPSGRLR